MYIVYLKYVDSLNVVGLNMFHLHVDAFTHFGFLRIFLWKIDLFIIKFLKDKIVGDYVSRVVKSIRFFFKTG